MAIIDSVKKLASKVGADTNGRTIAEQINNINRHLDSTGSRDIAEAVSKFADKEDGTAILTTKTITENGTYNASSDNANGYSSVMVNVPMTFNMIKLPLFNKGFDDPSLKRVVKGAILKSSNGVYVLPPAYAPDESPLMGTSPTIILVDPLVSMSDALGYDEACIMFTPDEHLDFTLPPFSNPYGNITGIDTIVPGDGKTYELNSSRINNVLTRTIKKYDDNFVITIE